MGRGGRPSSVVPSSGFRKAMLSRHKGNSHDEDRCTRYGCILGHAERCRRRRSAAQGAASSGASGWQGSDRQVSGRQGSDRQISTARRDQGLTQTISPSAFASTTSLAVPALDQGIPPAKAEMNKAEQRKKGRGGGTRHISRLS